MQSALASYHPSVQHRDPPSALVRRSCRCGLNWPLPPPHFLRPLLTVLFATPLKTPLSAPHACRIMLDALTLMSVLTHARRGERRGDARWAGEGEGDHRCAAITYPPGGLLHYARLLGEAVEHHFPSPQRIVDAVPSLQPLMRITAAILRETESALHTDDSLAPLKTFPWTSLQHRLLELAIGFLDRLTDEECVKAMCLESGRLAGWLRVVLWDARLQRRDGGSGVERLVALVAPEDVEAYRWVNEVNERR